MSDNQIYSASPLETNLNIYYISALVKLLVYLFSLHAKNIESDSFFHLLDICVTWALVWACGAGICQLSFCPLFSPFSFSLSSQSPALRTE